MNKLNLSALLLSSLFLSACSAKTTPITGTEQQKAEKLAAIISSGGQADCKVTNLADNSTTQIVISGKKMKFVGSDIGEGKKGTMINDTAFTYIWSEGEKVGFKTKIQPETAAKPTGVAAAPTTDASAQAAAYDDTTKYKLDCSRRSISDSEFVPPSDVNFTDFSEMMKGVPTK